MDSNDTRLPVGSEQFAIKKKILGLLFSQLSWLTFSQMAVHISKKYLLYFLVMKSWFTFPGRVLPISKKYLVYFLVK